MPGRKIHTEVVVFRGVVQGVGFRPTVYRIAQSLGMKGRVRNMGGIVQLVCTGAPEEIDVFVQEIVTRKPPMSSITGVERKIINTAVFHDFAIAQSSTEEDEIAVIPADIAICDECLREFYDPANPRYLHPFISCTNCGPRFSIIERLPYDRETTTMADFPMCDFCGYEYRDPAGRRYHAQTVSCHDCGPQPLIYTGEVKDHDYVNFALERNPFQSLTGTKEAGDRDSAAALGINTGRPIKPLPFDDRAGIGATAAPMSSRLDNSNRFDDKVNGDAIASPGDKNENVNRAIAEPVSPLTENSVRFDDKANGDAIAVPGDKNENVNQAIVMLAAGEVVALKGVGGYYLVCTPFDKGAVQKLREIKHREQKPFAVMFRDVSQIKDYCILSPQEEAAICSPGRPIVLLEQRPDALTERPAPSVLPASPAVLPALSTTGGSAVPSVSSAPSPASLSVSPTGAPADPPASPVVSSTSPSVFHTASPAVPATSSTVSPAGAPAVLSVSPSPLPAVSTTTGPVDPPASPVVSTTSSSVSPAGAPAVPATSSSGAPAVPSVSSAPSPAYPPASPVVSTTTAPSAFRPLAGGVCNTSRFVGAFLPSFGLQYLLLDALGPLIMTSANISELPLITEDKEMAEMAANEPLIGGVLYNERRIAAGLDDSVARLIDGEVQLIRRSKGYVPTPVYVQAATAITKDRQIFAAGGHLKSAFALSKGAYSYLSRHIGDLDSVESEAVYRATFEKMKAFFEIKPNLAVCDLHPDYFPTRFAEKLGLPLIYAQHHHAHIASVMAEHGLTGPVIGVGFDGTGYGTDGAIWGGEILICENASFERFSHLKYIDMIGGDASMKDAWKTAVSHMNALENTQTPHDSQGPRGPQTQQTPQDSHAPQDTRNQKSPHSLHDPQTSQTRQSMQKSQNSPGEKARISPPFTEIEKEFSIGLEPLAAYCRAQGTLDRLYAMNVDTPVRAGQSIREKLENTGNVPVSIEKEYGLVLSALKTGVNTVRTSSMGRLFDAASAMLGIHYENRYEGECAILLENAAQNALTKQRFRDKPTEQEELALYFHMEVAQTILKQCRLARDIRGIQRVCLSGGVFQNKILMEETLRLLRADSFDVYYNIHVPPNDGGIALGQNYIGMLSI